MEISSEALMQKIVEFLDEKKAQDIEVLNIGNISYIADFFVICSGNSTTQIKALADYVQEKLEALGYSPSHKEGYASANWILLDYQEIVIHIFHHESRSFYNLERLWSDAKQVDIKGLGAELNNQGGTNR